MRPLHKFPVDNKYEFSSFLDDLHENQCEIVDFIGDNPKRAFAKSASYYACEYCCGKAVQYKDQDDNETVKLRKQSQDLKKKKF